MSETKDLIADGERRKRVGMALAASNNIDRVTLGRLTLLASLLRSDTGSATIDDATGADDLRNQFADGGRWRGTVTKSVIADGFATIEGVTQSVRPSRHRGYVAVLRLADRAGAVDYLRTFAEAVAWITNEKTPPAATDGALDQSLAPTTTKEQTNGTA
ncbi:MAG: hypothetical protein NTV29_17160 [Planctomycetota bacterium]|nr:hypothetical protein [Planctomycetota bacterium]